MKEVICNAEVMNGFDQSKAGRLVGPNENWKLNLPWVIGHYTQIIIYKFNFQFKVFLVSREELYKLSKLSALR